MAVVFWIMAKFQLLSERQHFEEGPQRCPAAFDFAALRKSTPPDIFAVPRTEMVEERSTSKP